MTDGDVQKTTRQGTTRSEEWRRLYSEKMRGKEVSVGEGLVAFDAQGFVIGVVRDQNTWFDPPRALTDTQINTLSLVSGLVELSPSESRRVPLDHQNRRRREEFTERVTPAILAARRIHGRWPSVREVQSVLDQRGFPKGRKEKIAALIEELRQAEITKKSGVR